MRTRVWQVLALAALLSASLLAGCSAADDTTESDTPGTEAASGDSGSAHAVAGLDYATLLTPADVESVSGLTGLKTVPYDPKVGAGGNVNIAEADGQLVAMLIVQDAEYYDAWKSDGETFLSDYTPAVGDESFIGPDASVTPDSYIFAFRQGEYAVVLDTFFRVQGVTKILSVEQLAELAKIVSSRL
jgi:hypothetical protein